MTNKYIVCKCDELGPLKVSVKSLKKRIEATMRNERYYAVLETIETPRQTALIKCRGCDKYYQESRCGHGMGTLNYIYEIPKIDKKTWKEKPSKDPYSELLETEEARINGL